MKELFLSQDAFARAGGAGGGRKPAPSPTTAPDWPPPPSPFEKGTSATSSVAPPKGTLAYWMNNAMLVAFGLLFFFAFVQVVRQIIRQRKENRAK